MGANAALPLVDAAQGDKLPQPAGKAVRVRVSHYWPPLGGPNCARFVGGRCVSRMASGEPWQAWTDQAAACVPEWPFGTRFRLYGQEWVCLDRGGKIKTMAGVPWVDLLTADAPAPYGTIAEAELILEEPYGSPRKRGTP